MKIGQVPPPGVCQPRTLGKRGGVAQDVLSTSGFKDVHIRFIKPRLTLSVLLFVFFFFFFYCYAITVVCLFSPSLYPTPGEPTSLPPSVLLFE